MVKKTSLMLLIITQLVVSQICIAQPQNDSIYLPVFKLNEKGIQLFDEVLKTKHQFIEEDKGTFIISGKLGADSLVVVNVLYDKTWLGYGLTDFESPQYYGCVIYKNRLFMLDNSLKELESHLLNSSQCRKAFSDNGSIFLIINDREVVWSFILIDGKFENTMIYPPGVIFDFDSEDYLSEP